MTTHCLWIGHLFPIVYASCLSLDIRKSVGDRKFLFADSNLHKNTDLENDKFF